MKKRIERLLDCKGKMQELVEEMRELEDSLVGMELLYQGNYANILYVNGNSQNAYLYVEDEDGKNWEVDIPLQELKNLLVK